MTENGFDDDYTNACRKVLEAEPRGSQVLKHGIREKKRLGERRVREDAESDDDERSLAGGGSRTREAMAPSARCSPGRLLPGSSGTLTILLS